MSSMQDLAASSRSAFPASFPLSNQSALIELPLMCRRYFPTLKCFVLCPVHRSHRDSFCAVKVLPRAGSPTST
eukprot:CAMPEP_0118939276 /NCGR_PEP_ID=MMETSP1169-20130426/28463_1 /TAXON_ID=36882 /ORGANISM="Pyramimonas obovata, Strain CCMP722" /LENGTH=72 /DNA_ID=CAMNT_0006883505 /DNA_START=15 /DNA_END=229 /DNA_ORIENTATION=+